MHLKLHDGRSLHGRVTRRTLAALPFVERRASLEPEPPITDAALALLWIAADAPDVLVGADPGASLSTLLRQGLVSAAQKEYGRALVEITAVGRARLDGKVRPQIASRARAGERLLSND